MRDHLLGHPPIAELAADYAEYDPANPFDIYDQPCLQPLGISRRVRAMWESRCIVRPPDPKLHIFETGNWPYPDGTHDPCPRKLSAEGTAMVAELTSRLAASDALRGRILGPL
jgi:hypothetical protein